MDSGKNESESEILCAIRVALSRITGCDFQRLTQVSMEVGLGRYVRGGLANGAADLIGCVAGRYVALECKKVGGRLSKAQEQWHRRMRRAGAVVEVVHSPEEAVAVVKKVLEGGYDHC